MNAWQRFERPALILVAAIATLLLLIHPLRSVLMDFTVYFQAGERFRNGQNIYDHTYEITARDGRLFKVYYFYPPFLAWVLSFLVPVGFPALKVLWCLLSFTALTYIAFVFRSWLELLQTTFSSRTLLICSILFIVCFEPVYAGMMEGQANALVAACIIATIDNTRRKRQQLTGLSLALAIALKMSPALLLIPLLIRKQLVSIAWCVGTLFLIAFAIYSGTPSIAVYQDFLKPFGPLLAGTLERHYVFNFAFDKAVLQLGGLDAVVWARWVFKAMLLCGLGSSACALLRRPSDGWRTTLLCFGIFVCWMVLLAPTIWFHHLIWILMPLAALLLSDDMTREGYSLQSRLRFLTACFGLYFLFSQISQLHVLALRHWPTALHITSLLPGLCTLGLIVVLHFRYKQLHSEERVKTAL